MSEDAREIAQRIVREVLAAHDATPADAPPATAPGPDGTAADVSAPAGPATAVPAAGGTAVPTPRAVADDVADALDDSPARQAAKRIVAEVLAAHAEASRSAPDVLPVVAEAEEAGPTSATPVLQPVPGRPAVRPAEPAAPSVQPEDADVAEDAAAIARRIVASVLATQTPDGPPPIPAGLRRPPSIEHTPHPEPLDAPADDAPADDAPADGGPIVDAPAVDEPAVHDPAAARRAVQGQAVDGEVWVLSTDAAPADPASRAEVAGDLEDEDDESLFGADAEVATFDRADEAPDDPVAATVADDTDDESATHRGPDADDLTADHLSAPDEDTWLFGGPSSRRTVGEDRDPASEPTAMIGAFDPDERLPSGDAPSDGTAEDDLDPDPAVFAPGDEDGDVDGAPDRTAVLEAEVDAYPDDARGGPLSTLARDEDDWSGQEPTVAVPVAQPRRRTGRWLIASVLGAIALAVLLPLAVEALRSLVALS